MAKKADLKDTLWKAADKLRGSMDAAEYKHFVLGLVFLKYVSDAFTERHQQIADELAADDYAPDRRERILEDKDEYTGSGVFWVPRAARWDTIAKKAKSTSGEQKVGELIDSAMLAIEQDNQDLKGVLPKIFNRSSVDERRLAELVDLIGRIGFGGQLNGDGTRRGARDVLGEVYEYFLGMFALAEGRRGGEYYTPASVVKLLIEVLEPQPKSRVYDPCCGSGGMFVQAEKFIETHGGRPFDISVFGQELNENTWRLAKMNLAIHGIGADLGPRWGDSFHDDRHPDLRADVVLANPPFNISDWGGERLAMDPRWEYGVPPVGNANFAWLQHMASKLKPKGSAGIVLANGSMSSKQSGEGDIRRAMVEDGLVSCMIALPPQLFRSTQIPACLWFFTRDKTPQGSKRLADRRGEFLFIDARQLGVMENRTLRVLTAEEIARIADVYHVWRGTDRSREYTDEPGFCYSATIDEIRKHDFVLTPGRYVGAPKTEDDPESVSTKIDRLTKEVLARFNESARLEREVRIQLGRFDVGKVGFVSLLGSLTGFRRTTIGDLVASGCIELGDGYRTKRSEHGKPGLPILRVSDISNEQIGSDYEDFVHERYRTAMGVKISRPGDVILTTKGTVGRVAIIPENAPEVVYSPQVCFFRFNAGSSISKYYFYLWLKSPEFWSQARTMKSQTDMADYLSLRDIRSLEITVPEPGVDRQLAELVTPLMDRIEAGHAETRALVDLRDALLPTLMSGEIRINNAERAVEDVV